MANGKKPATYEAVGGGGETAHATFMLTAVLLEPFVLERGGPGGWWILPKVEVRLGRNILVPDVAGWRWERMPGLPAEQHFVTLAPDWICEVLSPGMAAVARERKLPLYHREGVGHVWLMDPFARTLEVYQRERSGWSLVASHVGEEPVCAEPFDAVPLELSLLWLDGASASR